jgi:hypothetical protein
MRLLLSALLLASVCLALYQDQAGEADFSERLVGIPDWQFLSTNRLILVSSVKNTISSINPTNGSIGKQLSFLHEEWRHVLQEQDHIIAASINEEGGKLATVSEMGNVATVRLWNLTTGFLLWESVSDMFTYEASVTFLHGSENLVVVTEWNVSCYTANGVTLWRYTLPGRDTNLKSVYHNVAENTVSVTGYTRKMV